MQFQSVPFHHHLLSHLPQISVTKSLLWAGAVKEKEITLVAVPSLR
jgi:hypothetical protein